MKRSHRSVLSSIIGPLCIATFASAAEISGFVLQGTNWTYEHGDLTFDGVLLKPAGAGPFPAVLISHGLGGSAETFGMNKAREMVGWGYVCIAPNYTHSVKNVGGNAARHAAAAKARRGRTASREQVRRK